MWLVPLMCGLLQRSQVEIQEQVGDAFRHEKAIPFSALADLKRDVGHTIVARKVVCLSRYKKSHFTNTFGVFSESIVRAVKPSGDAGIGQHLCI